MFTFKTRKINCLFTNPHLPVKIILPDLIIKKKNSYPPLTLTTEITPLLAGRALTVKINFIQHEITIALQLQGSKQAKKRVLKIQSNLTKNNSSSSSNNRPQSPTGRRRRRRIQNPNPPSQHSHTDSRAKQINSFRFDCTCMCVRVSVCVALCVSVKNQ